MCEEQPHLTGYASDFTAQTGRHQGQLLFQLLHPRAFRGETGENSLAISYPNLLPKSLAVAQHFLKIWAERELTMVDCGHRIPSLRCNSRSVFQQPRLVAFASRTQMHDEPNFYRYPIPAIAFR